MFESIKSLGHDIKLAATKPNEIKDPQRLSDACKKTKIIAVVAAIIAVVGTILTGPFGLLFGIPLLLGLHDTYKMAGNIQKIADDRVKGIEVPTPMTASDFANAIGRGTILAKPIAGLAARKAYANNGGNTIEFN